MKEIPEAKFDYKKGKKQGKTIHHGASNEKVARSCALIQYEHFAKHDQCPPPKVTTIPQVEEMMFMHSQIYIAGRYCKLQRMISNSCFIIKGKRVTEDSVEELIGNHLSKFFRNSGYKFSSAGREDTDVLMLGRGRPFYFELINPHKTIASPDEMKELQKIINDGVDEKVRVHDLQICTKYLTLT